ncbi:MAG: transposase [Candidatus Binatus sp.]|uniref:IS110 family transposase n=1 Tax=Candidatus Binatus sp. TaxID=2811406 RepID=UPI003C734A2D
MTSTKYIGMDVHKESISIAVRNDAGKIVMECVIETKASMILDLIDGLRGELQVTFEEGTWAAWLYDLLKPRVTKLVVCDPRKNASMREGNQSDKIDARRLAELLRLNHLSPVYHGEHGLRSLKELVRSYLTITKDLGRVMSRVKAIYRSWAIPCTGKQVYASRHRAEWMGKLGEGEKPRLDFPLYYGQLRAAFAASRSICWVSTDASPVDEMSSAAVVFITALARLISSDESQCTESRIPPFCRRLS